jgi:hypothetical protein
MASLLVLLNRAVSYFNKPNNEINNTDCERSDDEVMLHDDSCKYLCSTCRWFVTIENYNFERERCNDCCLLTQDEESDVLRVMNSNISHYMNLVQMSNANNAQMRGAKL